MPPKRVGKAYFNSSTVCVVSKLMMAETNVSRIDEIERPKLATPLISNNV